MKNKVKSILIDLELEGNGVVNYDSGDQKWVLKNVDFNGDHNNNVSYAKKNFYKSDNPDEKMSYKLKISSNCIHKSTFNDMVALTGSVTHNRDMLLMYISHPSSIMSGYLFPTLNLKKKSPISLTDAEQTCNAVSKLELFTRSGEKVKNETDEDGKKKSDNSLFKKETVGDIKYRAKGVIDLTELQFISGDQKFDRQSFLNDEGEKFLEKLKLILPDPNGIEFGDYVIDGTSVNIPESGILLSEKNVEWLTKYYLTKLLETYIHRKNSYARVSSMKIKYVEKVTTDTFSNDRNWIKIDSLEDIEKLEFSTHKKYVPHSIHL